MTPKSPPKPDLTRLQVAEMLGRTKPAVISYHGKGLTPRQNSAGEWRYDPDEVARLAATLRANGRKGGPRGGRDNGTLARAVYKHFDLGTPLPEIVQTLCVEPEKVLAWHAIYLRGFGKPPRELTPEQELARDKLQFEIQAERNRIELAREKMHLAEQRRREE